MDGATTDDMDKKIQNSGVRSLFRRDFLLTYLLMSKFRFPHDFDFFRYPIPLGTHQSFLYPHVA
jgi:hypothetical protein